MLDTKPALDFILGVGVKQGGIETTVNAIASYTTKENYSTRVIQILEQHSTWTDPDVSFYVLKEDNKLDFDDVIERLKKFYSTHTPPDVIVVNSWPVLVALVKIAISELGLKCKVVFWHHSIWEAIEKEGLGGPDFFAYADAHLAINATLKEKILKIYPEAKVFDIDNPIRNSKIFYNSIREKRELVFVGRITEVKRLDIILNALKSSRSTYQLKVFGAGEQEKEMKKLTQNLNLENQVEFLGYDENPFSKVSSAQALIMASDFEGSPLVVREALMSGMGVIATRVGDLPGIIDQGKNGFLYNVNDQEELIHILKEIENRPLPLFSSETCKKSIEEKVNHSYQKYINVINKILD